MGYGQVEGQCGTCLFAKEFDFADSPSGPEDGVHCISIEQAKLVDRQEGNNRWMSELTEYGFMDMWRLEAMAEEDYKCPNWLSKELNVLEQMLPAPDEAPLTACPGCGKEYNVTEEERSDYQKLAADIYRHSCGRLVKFTGG